MSLSGSIQRVKDDLIYIVERGEGPPVILLHGFMVSHWTFRSVVEPLSARFRTIAFDLPGHGESESPRDYDYSFRDFSESLIGVMDHLGIERASLVGHSMGGGVALYTTAHRPERVERLILTDTSIYPIDLPITAQLSLLPVVGELLFFQLSGRRALRQYLSQVYDDPSLFTESFVDYYWDRLCRPGHKLAAHRTLHSVCEPWELLALPRRLECPTMVIWGERDRILPAYMGHRLGEEIPDVRMEILDDCGHSPPEERPDEFVRLVNAFVPGAIKREARG